MSYPCVEAIEKMGYSLSKPYVLKIFDIKVQWKLAFADDAGICKIMRHGSPERRQLSSTLSEQDIETVVRAKIETIVLDLLRLCLNPKKGKRDEALERIGMYSKFIANMSSPLQFAVQLAEAIVLCKDVDVGRLDKALQYLEPLKEAPNRDGSEGAIVEFLAGTGSKLYEEAVAVFSKRSEEMKLQLEYDAFEEKHRNFSML